MEGTLASIMEMEISGCSSISSAAIDCSLSWGDWSPAIDWGHIAGTDKFDCADDFDGMIESMMCDADTPFAVYYELPDTPALHDWSTSVSAASTNCPGTPVEEPPRATLPRDDDGGLRLVHLLMAAAEALTGEHKSRDLALVILARLRELLARGGATSMERLAAHFTGALQGILDGAGARLHEEPPHPGDVLEAFQLLQDMSPYVKFGHFTANQAIFEAVADERRVHIIDYDIMEGVQWASLMQSFVSRKDSSPPPHLRITAITRSGASRRSLATMHETGRRLAAFAASIGQPFSFSKCRLDPEELFQPEAVKVVKGEAVVLNCVLQTPHLPRRSATSVGSFLASAGTLGARLVTVVEEEGGGLGGGEEEIGFVGRFMAELQRFSAMWDSLEAGFPMQGRAREVVERLILGPRIAGAVGRAYRKVEEGEGEWEGWAEWAEASDFRRVGLSFFNLCQARLLLGLFNDGYRVEEESPNKLVLCWKSCRLLSASVWSAPPPEFPAAACFDG